ncbi:response regulator transcription factor [Petralouisia muris]|jgi:DNA-binding LytR/AlgR family response regulator|uniref:Response regulator transcription factor n=1 Tax=Petralouisia muris TaxID=3032872 RepID=A0AC61RZE0_9FIRM|nr:LytTR family DNA-binding domain-containing protein [Petralouisia muris]TGY97059.1 response regulator transcription factor [Petralouisia muris]
MISIAVCDDEVLECSQIAGTIKSILNEMQVPCMVRQFHSGKELLGAAKEFDLVFLDIIMEELDGMKTAELFRQKTAGKILVFISSSKAYVFDAYEVEAFWYLVKPMEEGKLQKVLERAVRKLERRSEEFIIVSRQREKKKLFLAEISYFEIRGRMIYAHQTEEIFDFYEQIGILEQKLQGKGFFRCHKSYLVNLNCVRSYNRQEAMLDSGEKILISRRRYEEFCQEMLRFMKEKGGMR